MGLDVYLYKYSKFSKKSDGIELIDSEEININSAKYPDHMFKIGYLRSSYNEGGINSVLRRFNIPDLYQIFGVGDRHESYIFPNWKQALKNVKSAIRQFKTHMGSTDGKFDCVELSGHVLNPNPPKDPAAALKIFINENQTHTDKDFKSFGNRNGDFWLDGRKVYAVIPGLNVIDQRCSFVIVEKEADSNQWYLESLEITQEMIEYVLKQPDPDKYCLGWSA